MVTIPLRENSMMTEVCNTRNRRNRTSPQMSLYSYQNVTVRVFFVVFGQSEAHLNHQCKRPVYKSYMKAEQNQKNERQRSSRHLTFLKSCRLHRACGYFSQCHPKLCRVTISMRNNIDKLKKVWMGLLKTPLHSVLTKANGTYLGPVHRSGCVFVDLYGLESRWRFIWRRRTILS